MGVQGFIVFFGLLILIYGLFSRLAEPQTYP
jgi:hypothetical protein